MNYSKEESALKAMSTPNLFYSGSLQVIFLGWCTALVNKTNCVFVSPHQSKLTLFSIMPPTKTALSKTPDQNDKTFNAPCHLYKKFPV